MNRCDYNTRKNPWPVPVLSLIPGLAHLYLGIVKKALGLFIIDTGLALTWIFSGTHLMKLLMVNIYLITGVPAAVETWQLARHGRSKIDTDSQWYVTALLLTTGFSALPLLWQSRRFSRKAKIAWTVAVPVLAGLFFTLLINFWDGIEGLLRQIF